MNGEWEKLEMIKLEITDIDNAFMKIVKGRRKVGRLGKSIRF